MTDLNLAFTRTLADALATLGLRHVCISPGSRNTPLTVAFAEHPAIRDWSHHDERSAGFFAVGLAKAGGAPVALVSTSGTAAAEYLPAIVEAQLARVPLLVLTADRPPELRDLGAPQAIDQVKLYGDAVKWFHDTGPPDTATVGTAAALAAHAWGEACDVPQGAVHLNCGFRDPLAPAPGDTGPLPSSDGRSGGPPSVAIARRRPEPDTLGRLAADLAGRRSMFVVGAVPSEAAAPIGGLADTLGAVVFADPQSGLRCGPAPDERSAVMLGAADLLATAGALDTAIPEVVVRWGPVPTSKATWRWLEDHPEVPQILIDPGGHRDPLASASMVIRADTGATALDLTAAGPTPAPEGWGERWRALDLAAVSAVGAALDDEPFPNEPAIARTVWEATPEGALLFVGSSMPIRDIDTFAATRPTRIQVVANRGASGIDGTISGALGAAAAADRPAVALVGDVAALHDLGALVTMARLDLALTVVVVHNDGGGIFGLLDQSDPERVAPEVYERHLGTPHGVDLVAVATALGIEAVRVTTADQLADIVSTPHTGPLLAEVRSARGEVAERRRRMHRAVAAALG